MRTSMLAGLFAVAVTFTARAADPLLSWNDGAAKQAVLQFVEKTTTGSSDFVPPPALARASASSSTTPTPNVNWLTTAGPASGDSTRASTRLKPNAGRSWT